MVVSIYLAIAVICVILLGIFAALGGIADFDMDGGVDFDVDAGMDVDVGDGFGDFGGPGVSPLSLPVILMWGTTFGAVGGILESLQTLDPYLVAGIAAIAGILGAALMFYALVKMSRMAQSDSAVDHKALVGEDCEVWVPIKPDKPGKVVIETKERGRTILTAMADQELKTGTPVEIVEAKTSGVKVRPLQGDDN